jgi:hypothetical protein
LRVKGSQPNPFLANAIDVRRFHSHDVTTVGSDIHPANIVTHDDEDVWLRLGLN